MRPVAGLLSGLYGAGLALDRALRPKHRLPARVVSVGNIAVGGRAKTPFTIYLAQGLKSRGFEPVVLTRGYGRSSSEPVELSTHRSSVPRPDETGDEALEIFSFTQSTVLVGSKRRQNAERFLESAQVPDASKLVFVLDDGFQHWSLARDFDLVLIDPKDRRDRLLPRGRLREGAGALERADLVLERGKDFEKLTKVVRAPAWSEGLTILTTRAPDEAYEKYFTETYERCEFLQLRDHATEVEMRQACRAAQFTTILVGAKEAVKLLPWNDYLRLISEGRFELVLDQRKLDLRFVSCELRIMKESELWSKLLGKLGESRERETR